MSFKIGFALNSDTETDTRSTTKEPETILPRKCLADIYFPSRHITCTYYNDLFNLNIGDAVYVNGKLEGLTGRVVGINYNFKIKLSDYKRVISLVDTNVKGKFYFSPSHLISTDSSALPFEKISTWFYPPLKEEDEFVSSFDDTEFHLDTLSEFKVTESVAQKGWQYYNENKVVYIEISRKKGRAIVNGSKYYTVEFEYSDGLIKNLVCDCYCSFNCKHEFATMLQLKETLEHLKKHYDFIDTSDYFCTIAKNEFFEFVAAPQQTGSMIL